jgi:hypothetical protein
MGQPRATDGVERLDVPVRRITDEVADVAGIGVARRVDADDADERQTLRVPVRGTAQVVDDVLHVPTPLIVLVTDDEHRQVGVGAQKTGVDPVRKGRRRGVQALFGAGARIARRVACIHAARAPGPAENTPGSMNRPRGPRSSMSVVVTPMRQSVPAASAGVKKASNRSATAFWMGVIEPESSMTNTTSTAAGVVKVKRSVIRPSTPRPSSGTRSDRGRGPCTSSTRVHARAPGCVGAHRTRTLRAGFSGRHSPSTPRMTTPRQAPVEGRTGEAGIRRSGNGHGALDLGAVDGDVAEREALGVEDDGGCAGRRVRQGVLWAAVACVAEPVGVRVDLFVIGDDAAVVGGVRNAVVVDVPRRPHRRVGITGVAEAVGIRVRLIGIGDGGTDVARIAVPVGVGVGLAVVGGKRTVVDSIEYAVVVGIGRRVDGPPRVRLGRAGGVARGAGVPGDRCPAGRLAGGPAGSRAAAAARSAMAGRRVGRVVGAASRRPPTAGVRLRLLGEGVRRLAPEAPEGERECERQRERGRAAKSGRLRGRAPRRARRRHRKTSKCGNENLRRMAGDGLRLKARRLPAHSGRPSVRR